ncbi:LacI family DNA-binding transcriptional regulator [Coraliomargarita sp. SDUM461003]|uniref:LacI family DNA-binding transcriptional regulator n=2 Tax=Thalassobacterium maritimum TaxID=3041265 RepID=A0ABU1AWB8_9BACT|nr:LacI family DNA-binding transcriptional regulator [Coraliomargarita sp. SDUM461003]
MKDVAQCAGVHPSSVSMALRNHPRISRATCERIQKIAEEMGYRPDPNLSALAAYRSAVQPKTRSGEIAILTSGISRLGQATGTTRLILQAMSERAEALGYSLALFNMLQQDLKPDQVNRIIRVRGIQGLIIGRTDYPNRTFLKGIDWGQISAVRVGRRPQWPPVTRVDHHQYATIQLILGKMLLRGYRRIGLYHQRSNLRALAFYPEAAYQHLLNRVSRTRAYPTFYSDCNRGESLFEWAERYQFDAIISNQMPQVMIPDSAAREAFFDARGFALMNLLDKSSELAGVYQNLGKLGERAVDVLVAQMHRGERGFPKVVSNTMVEGEWSEGKSLPRRRSE